MKLVIRPNDIEWEAFLAGGKGGQHQNKTSSAVRYRHKPTGITAECRNERSQHQNRRTALSLLVIKLTAMLTDDIDAKRSQAYRDKPEAAFAHHRRTYVMCGKDQRVVDHLTGVESDPRSVVLRGEIDPFIRAQLIQNLSGPRS